MSLIEFKITHVDKVEGGIIPNEDIVQAKFMPVQKRNYELHEIEKAYNKGLIILKIDWVPDFRNDGIRLVVYRGKVE